MTLRIIHAGIVNMFGGNRATVIPLSPVDPLEMYEPVVPHYGATRTEWSLLIRIESATIGHRNLLFPINTLVEVIHE